MDFWETSSEINKDKIQAMYDFYTSEGLEKSKVKLWLEEK